MAASECDGMDAGKTHVTSRQSRLPLIMYILIGIAAFLRFVVPQAAAGVLALPPASGDGPDYDMIAVSLAGGHGFGRNKSDPGWRAPYEQHGSRRLPRIQENAQFGPTTVRPPLFPLALSFIYRLAGRNFGIWRVMNSMILAACFALAVALARRVGGWAAAVIALLFAWHDYEITPYANRYLTEGMAMLGVLVLAWLFLRTDEKRRTRNLVMAGCVFALLVLTRSMFVLWYPFALGLAAWSGSRAGGRARRSMLIFLIASVAICLPWWVRNCILLRSFMPTGTQGGINLCAGFCDRAQEKRGIWFGQVKREEFRDFRSDASGILRERDMARYGMGRALEWIRRHPGAAFTLAFVKMRSMWMWVLNGYGIMVAYAAIGFAWIFFRRENLVMGTFFLAQMLAVGATWSVGGRFLVPLHPFLWVYAGVGLAGVGGRLFRQARVARRMRKSKRVHVPLL